MECIVGLNTQFQKMKFFVSHVDIFLIVRVLEAKMIILLFLLIRVLKTIKKNAMSFNKHELSERHKSSIEKWNLYLNVQLNQKSVANELIHSRNKEIAENRKQVHFLRKRLFEATMKQSLF